MGKRVIRLTEADIENIVKKVISEQTEEVLVNRLNDKIKSVMVKNQNEILSDVKVEVDQNGDNLVLRFAAENERPFIIQLRPQSRGLYSKSGTLNRDIPSIPLSNFYDEIWEGDEDLKRYYQENENIKKQMDDLKVPIRMYSDPRVELKIFVIKNNRKNRGDKYVRGGQTNLGFFFSNAGAKFGVSSDIILETEVGGLAINLGEVNILPPQVDPSEPIQPEVATEKIKLDLIDVFEYDSIKMKDPSGYQEILNKFKNDLSQGLKRMVGFKEFLEKQTLVVNGYASQDDDPAANIGGKLPACSKYVKGPRSEYNKCLSQKRAQKVANDLQEIFNSLGVKSNIKSVGHGETHEFGGEGWDPEKKKTLDSKEQLSSNRRVIFNIPKYTETTRN